MKMTEAQESAYTTMKRRVSKKRPWLPMSALPSYDGRTVKALVRRGMVEIDKELGFRPVNKSSIN